MCLVAFGLGASSFAQKSLIPDQELTSLQPGDIVAIWDKATNKFLYGSDAQNLAFGLAEDAFQDGRSGWLWMVEEGEGHLLFRLQTPSGGHYALWGSEDNNYLNSQPTDGGWCSFILGLNNQWGQDGANLALWDIEEAEGGFYLRNFGTDMYLNDAGPARYPLESATVWTFCTLIDDSPLRSENTIETSVINNGDAEGDDLESFPLSHNGNSAADTGGADFRPEIVADGYEGRGFKIVSDELEETYNDDGGRAWTNWSTQFFIMSNQAIPAGTKYKVSFYAKADNDANITSGIHGKPRTWTGGLDFSFDLTNEWQEFSYEGTISDNTANANEGIVSIAFDMNNAAQSNNFYFDNIQFVIQAATNDVKHNPEAIRVLFPEFTNIPELIKATGKTRLMFPNDCVTVTVDGEAAPVSSVEGDKKGQFMIFLDEDYVLDNELSDETKVVVKFTNPADEKYRITLLDEAKTAVEDFELESVYDDDLDITSFAWSNPELESSDPENASFNLPATISEFKLLFDKKVRGQLIQAKLDGTENLTVSPQDASAEITLTRTGSAPLAEGDHIINVTKVYTFTPYAIPDGTEDAPVTLTFSVGTPSMSADLLTALQNASTQIENATVESERYLGSVYTNLAAAIEKYQAEGEGYTAPSVVRAAVKDLETQTKALADHMTLCDTYDNDLVSAQGIVSEYAGTPFASHELYQTLAVVTAQYEGKLLTEDDELKPAVDALDQTVKSAQRMFSKGESRFGDTGIKVLVERIRLGKEALMALGVPEDDEIIVLAENAMTDDDVLADRIKQHLSMKIFKALKDPATAADMFAETGIDEDGATIAPEYDMTVFVKNPNIYAAGGDHLGISDENVPGWVIPSNDKPGFDADTSWGNNRINEEGVPEDGCFNNWCNSARMENTVTDLPAGLYVADLYANDWLGKECGDAFAFVKTSDALDPEEGEQPDRDLNYTATTDLTGLANSRGHSHRVDPVEVLDGKLTLGVQFGRGTGDTQFMFDYVRLYLVGPAQGHDYAADYEQIITGVKTAQPAKVRSVAVYDLNGRRVVRANKGFSIVKRVMSDGTIQTDKVVR